MSVANEDNSGNHDLRVFRSRVHGSLLQVYRRTHPTRGQGRIGRIFSVESSGNLATHKDLALKLQDTFGHHWIEYQYTVNLFMRYGTLLNNRTVCFLIYDW
jgi:hypothetical protein